ncbi:MAG: hypothetical protein K0Q55_362 [Verrucomicrobia bacterium]|jgi:hypothetical protein|nr:hypothetical protein [Verrucomicrobiota bacterium]
MALLLVNFSLPAAEQRFVQDRFAIGFWWPPHTSENLEDRYREIAEANFTVVIGTAGTTAEQQLKLCEKFGLRAIVRSDLAVDKLPESEVCWGYMLADEPNAAAFPQLAKRAEEIRQQRSGRFGYVNLFPNYASAGQLGNPTYDEHVAKFVEIVKPEVLSMDHYPAMRPDRDTRESYCANLETMRKYSLKAGIPFWNYFYSMPFNDRLDPTEAQIRWQINASLAYGAKGVLYFCYWTPGKGAKGAGEFPKGGAIITAEGLKTRHYEEARRINAELKNLGPTLMQLTSTGAYRVNTGKEPAIGLTNSPIRNLSRVGSDPHSEFIVGTFRHKDGRRAVLLVNHNHSFTAWPTVEFDAPLESVSELNKVTGREMPVVDDSPELNGLQLSFGAAEARLFLLP